MKRYFTLASRLFAALAACLLTAGGCTSGPDTEGIHPTPAKASDSRYPTRWPIKHVIFLIKENRSFDSMFGLFPGANGATVANDHGTIRPLTEGTDQRLPHDLPHDYPAAVKSYDGGKMDGFNQSIWSDRYAFTEMHADQLPNYWHWAKSFVLGDNFFASVNGPSFPNHMFTIAAQSGRTVDNPNPPTGHQGKYKSWGCDSPPSEKVEVYDTEGKVQLVPPCFDFKTVGDELEAKGIPWSYYSAPPRAYTDPGHSGYIWSSYAAVRHIRNDKEEWASHIFPTQNLLGDISKGYLAPVTWITPLFALSEHPEYNFCHGENWTSRVVNAVMKSPMWKDTAIFIVWDDWGGFYDHVPPKQIDRFGLGVRVPMILLSPYAKTGWIDHRRGEFSSVVRFMEDNWSLGVLTDRDRKAGNLSYDFDFAQEPRQPDPLPLRTDCEGPIFSPPPPETDK